MLLLIVQLAILIAVVFIVGALIGRVARRRKSNQPDLKRVIAAAALSTPAPEVKSSDEKPVESGPVIDAEPESEIITPAEAAPAPVRKSKGQPAKAAVVEASPVTELVEEKPVAVVEIGRPKGRDGARRGQADDLTRIKGVGQALQGKLFALGIFHFDQIAALTPEESAWVGQHMSFPGRIEREEWISQAEILASVPAKAPAKPSGKPAKPIAKVAAKATAKPVAKKIAAKTPVKNTTEKKTPLKKTPVENTPLKNTTERKAKAPKPKAE